MTHEEICTYEVCKLAKEKGFPQEIDIGTHWTTTKYYKNSCIGEYFVGDVEKVETMEDEIAAIHLIENEGIGVVMPTQSLLQRWLREEKNIHIAVFPNLRNSYEYDWIVYIKGVECWLPTYSALNDFATYELALEDALKYALDNLVI